MFGQKPVSVCDKIDEPATTIMALPQFDDLPFNARPDLTPYLIHLTKNTKKNDNWSALQNLISILQMGEVMGSSSKKSFIKGPNTAACLMDVPFSALKYVLTPENSDPGNPRYEPFGIVLTKKYAYNKGCRPVLYLSNKEMIDLRIPEDEKWRVVRFEVAKAGWISWLHEREWRCKGDLKLPAEIQAVLVRNTDDAKELSETIAANPDDFLCKPKAIIPLTVISQGLLSSAI
jgi:hypothetical protein